MGTSSIDKHESIYIQDVNNLNNGNYPQIVISGGCKPAKFTEDCIAEHFLTNPSGGAVAFIGNANNGYADETYQYKNFLVALYSKQIYHIGTILNQMINYNDFSTIHEYYRLRQEKKPRSA